MIAEARMIGIAHINSALTRKSCTMEITTHKAEREQKRKDRIKYA